VNTPSLPISARPDFIPLPSDPKAVTAEQRRVVLPGIEQAVIAIGRAYVAAHLVAPVEVKKAS